MFGLFISPYTSYSDQQLCDAMYNHDVLAFEEIYDRYSPRLLGYLSSILIDKISSKDVLSNCLIKLFNYLQETQGNNLKGLAYRIAHNEMVNYIKSNRYCEWDDIVWDQQEYNGINALDNVELEYKKDQIMNVMNQIDPTVREIVQLYYLEERSYNEIATMMGMNISTVGVRIMRARDKLRSLLPI